jgi:hypothetical protein
VTLVECRESFTGFASKGGVGVFNEVLEALGVSLGMPSVQFGQASLLGRTVGGVSVEDFCGGLWDPSQMVGVLLVEHGGAVFPVEFEPEPVLPSG